MYRSLGAIALLTIAIAAPVQDAAAQDPWPRLRWRLLRRHHHHRLGEFATNCAIECWNCASVVRRASIVPASGLVLLSVKIGSAEQPGGANIRKSSFTSPNARAVKHHRNRARGYDTSGSNSVKPRHARIRAAYISLSTSRSPNVDDLGASPV